MLIFLSLVMDMMTRLIKITAETFPACLHQLWKDSVLPFWFFTIRLSLSWLLFHFMMLAFQISLCPKFYISSLSWMFFLFAVKSYMSSWDVLNFWILSTVRIILLLKLCLALKSWLLIKVCCFVLQCCNLMLIESIPKEPLCFHMIPFDCPCVQYTIQVCQVLHEHIAK